MTETELRQNIQKVVDELGLTLTSTFVPWSKSRSAGETFRTLNWKVTLLKFGREVLTTDYSAGQAYCPSYQQPPTVDSQAAVQRECETGLHNPNPRKVFGRLISINPKLLDVLWSLLLDADALDYSTYEEWASSLGCDEDSRKGEKIYRECLSIGLKLRNGLGEGGLKKLTEAFQDY